MKIKTNAGEVELTAEMVCRGMVFAPKDPRDYCLGEGRVFVVGHRDDANGVWRDARDENLGTNVFGADRLLGCDPIIASRADCERFGVHGDAGAHGFARLRDGGAVDLTEPNNFRRGMVFEIIGEVYGSARGERFALLDRIMGDGNHGATWDCSSGASWKMWKAVRDKGVRFIGLDARHASPEGVRRLCCGEYGSDQIDGGNRTTWAPQCTLAIGDHDEHEDLATGVKWSARPNPLEHLRARAAAFVSQPVCADCDKPAEIELLARCGAQQRLLKRCGCGEKVITVADRDVAALPSPAIEWRNGSASLGQSQAHVLRDGDVYRWQVNHLGLRIRDGVESRTFDAHAAAGRILFAVHDATAGIEWLAGFFGLLFRVHDFTPAAKRAKQEAPLVALVNAAPEGLDPIGWRAAVLAVHEECPKWSAAEIAAWLTPATLAGSGDFAVAYRRAITPAPKVDRVRATWKTRGPVLPCDNGEDE